MNQSNNEPGVIPSSLPSTDGENASAGPVVIDFLTVENDDVKDFVDRGTEEDGVANDELEEPLDGEDGDDAVKEEEVADGGFGESNGDGYEDSDQNSDDLMADEGEEDENDEAEQSRGTLFS